MKEFSTCRSLESPVVFDGNMAGDETLVEAMFGECDGNDIMVGTLGSDLYIDGVCSASGGGDAELNDEVGCGGAAGSVEEDKCVIPLDGGASGVGNGISRVSFEDSVGVRSLKGKSEDEVVESDGNDMTLKKLVEQKNIDPGEVDNKILEKEVKSEVNNEAEVDNRESVEGQAGIDEQIGSLEEQEIKDEEFDDAGQQKTNDGKVMKHAPEKNTVILTEKEGEFSLHDMVWGKVKRHPWWPGQIFDSSDASALAMKHFKKDCYLVAYFGDKTFAWNEASQLKPFRTHFSDIEKQNSSETFQNAVGCALDEVRRRVEFGLTCSCIPKATYEKIRVQRVENAGIKQEVGLKNVIDDTSNVSSFSPVKLIEYLKTLSEFPTGGFDRLELLIVKAQLLAFYRLKGYSSLPKLQYGGSLGDDNTVTNDAEKNSSEIDEHATHATLNNGQTGAGNLKNINGSGRKRKDNLKGGIYSGKRKRSLSELSGRTPESPYTDFWHDYVDGNPVSPASSKKRRSIDHYADESGMKGQRKTISLAKISNTTRPSFDIGNRIRKVASQLTGPSPSMFKCSGDRSQMADGSADGFSSNPEETQKSSSSSFVPSEFSSLEDLLSLLKSVAQEPRGDCSFMNVIVSFFSDFRNSVIVGDVPGEEIFPTNKVVTKRKKQPFGESPETFEFNDPIESYWTDKAFQNVSEEQPSHRTSGKGHQHTPSEPEKHAQPSHRIYSRKRFRVSNHAATEVPVPDKPPGYIDENAPAELVLNFADLDSVPSETSLNKIFKRFGPLKETETEVDRGSCRARVVFKKCADAEVAFSSSKKFNIFGAASVNYQLNYTPSALFKAPSFETTQDQEMHLDLSNFELNVV